MNNQEIQTFLNIIDNRIKKYINENKVLRQYCGKVVAIPESNEIKYKIQLLGYTSDKDPQFEFINKSKETLSVGDFVYIQTVGTDLNTGIISHKVG